LSKNDIRRFSLLTTSWENFKKQFEVAFPPDQDTLRKLHYIDTEGDFVSLTCEREWEEFVKQFSNERIIKLYFISNGEEFSPSSNSPCSKKSKDVETQEKATGCKGPEDLFKMYAPLLQQFSQGLSSASKGPNNSPFQDFFQNQAQPQQNDQQNLKRLFDLFCQPRGDCNNNNNNNNNGVLSFVENFLKNVVPPSQTTASSNNQRDSEFPTEENANDFAKLVQKLSDMGFDTNQSAHVLRKANGNLEAEMESVICTFEMGPRSNKNGTRVPT